MKVRKKEFTTGDTVVSHYARPWTGVVIGGLILADGGDRRKGHWVFNVLALVDANGNPIRKPFMRRLDAAWLARASSPIAVPDKYRRVYFGKEEDS